MMLPGLEEIESAAAIVHGVIPPTPLIRWPLLCERTGADIWIKHENHTPVGAFKLRGGLVYMERLRRVAPWVRGVIAATRGNHGQSVAFAAAKHGLRAVIVVPRGNSREKNAAMQALRAELIECGHDFQEAYENAVRIAAAESLHMVPSFDATLVSGVATYGLELFRGGSEFDAVYVPIGLGSGICGVIAVRNALGLKTQVIGVCAAGAPAYARSFAAGRPIATETAETIADGMACRTPLADAVSIINQNAARVVTVDDGEIRFAMQALFSDTHNAAEGAGAAALAALLRERNDMRGRRVALILTGGNVDRDVFAQVLAAGAPAGCE
jgi:threonine dehydratase